MVKSKGALAYIDIFVDDFLGITQGNKARQEEVKRTVALARRCAAPPIADGPAHAPRPCITEKYETGQHHVGHAKKYVGVGYRFSTWNYPPPTTQSHMIDDFVAGGGGPTTSLAEAVEELTGGSKEHDAGHHWC